ncbi:MAG: hypothetical protein PGN21_06990 [Sphingomonas paucimobilis]
MPNTVRNGVPILGIIFVMLAVYKLAKGDPWVVWAILGFLFGGFGAFHQIRSGRTDA